MDNALTECAAVDETVVFLNYFKDLHDPRQQGKVCYPRGNPSSPPVGGRRRGGDHHRDSHLWRQETSAKSNNPRLRRWLWFA